MGFFSSTPSVTAAEAAQKVSEAGTALVDVRSPDEFRDGHARAACNCPLPVLNDCVDKLKKYSEVYLMCQSGGRSSVATLALRAAGINAINVSGGILAWRAQGLPVDGASANKA